MAKDDKIKKAVGAKIDLKSGQQLTGGNVTKGTIATGAVAKNVSGQDQFASDLFPAGGSKNRVGAFVQKTAEKVVGALKGKDRDFPDPSSFPKGEPGVEEFMSGAQTVNRKPGAVTKIGTAALKATDIVPDREKLGVLGKQLAGGARKATVPGSAQDKQERIMNLKPGESIGNFSVGRTTAAQENARIRGKGTGRARTDADVSPAFASASRLAQIFASPEFQNRKAKGIRQGAAAKGARADVEAKTERMKVVAGAIEKFSLVPGNEAVIKSLTEQFQELSQGRGEEDAAVASNQLALKLKLTGKLSDEEIQQIVGG